MLSRGSHGALPPPYDEAEEVAMPHPSAPEGVPLHHHKHAPSSVLTCAAASDEDSREGELRLDDWECPQTDGRQAKNYICDDLHYLADGEVQALRAIEHTCLKQLCPAYVLHKITSSGGSANEFAMLEASDYNPKLAAVALGSYVTDSNNFLHKAAVVMVTGKTKECIPEVEMDKCLKRYPTGVYNVCLPYYHHGHGEDQGVNPTAGNLKALLLEFVQAVSGLIFSTNFLVSLMRMMERAACKIAVDEFLTGGRTSGSFLANTTRSIKPHFITLGKWTQCGLVLKRANIKDEAEAGL
ncbi:MAG: hypothetical protein SGPRY_000020 [Prymnesium sp.]